MEHRVRAVYEQGYLRLLEPIDLQEGDEVSLLILPENEQTRWLLKDLLVSTNEPLDEIDDDTLQQQIDAATRGVSLSDAVIEDRREGP
jgi:predicted DNA-binding antitoxin AbrB/MazE fold protein